MRCPAERGAARGPSARLLAGAARPGLYADPAFLRGRAQLGERGLTFDAFLFHVQLGDLVEMARQAPGTTIVVNHSGCPIGQSGTAGPGDPVFGAWARQVERRALLGETARRTYRISERDVKEGRGESDAAT